MTGDSRAFANEEEEMKGACARKATAVPTEREDGQLVHKAGGCLWGGGGGFGGVDGRVAGDRRASPSYK